MYEYDFNINILNDIMVEIAQQVYTLQRFSL